MWFVIAHWVITFDLSLVLCLFLTSPFFDFAEVDVVCRICHFILSMYDWNCHFIFFLVLVWISLGDLLSCEIVLFYMCLLYFCNLTAVFFFSCSLCSLITFLSIKTATTSNRLFVKMIALIVLAIIILADLHFYTDFCRTTAKYPRLDTTCNAQNTVPAVTVCKKNH